MPVPGHYGNNCSSVVSLYQIGEQACPPGYWWGPTVRDHYLIHCVLNGKGTYFIGERQYRLEKGQGFLIVPGVVTFYQADQADPWHYAWVGFNGTDAGIICSLCGIGLEYPIFSFDDTGKMAECIRELKENHHASSNGFLAMSRLYEFFSMIQGTDYPAARGIQMIDLAVDYINKNYSYGITVKQIANHLGISRSQLFRIFKESMGRSVQEYLLIYRLEQAESMLRNTDRNIKEIMYSCGFQDMPNFSRQFRRIYGLPPGAYRKRLEQQRKNDKSM